MKTFWKRWLCAAEKLVKLKDFNEGLSIFETKTFRTEI
jgi:hypothetical protein